MTKNESMDENENQLLGKSLKKYNFYEHSKTDHFKDCSFCVYCFNTRNEIRKEIADEISLIRNWLSLEPNNGQKSILSNRHNRSLRFDHRINRR